jgi:hypothetical protein
MFNGVDVVPADPPQHFRESLLDFVGLAPVQRAHLANEVAIALGHRVAIEITGDLGEPRRGAVGEQRVDAADVVHHVAVAQRARAAAVVGGHAADRRPVRRRRVNREKQPILAQQPIEAVEHHPRLDPRPPPFDIDRDHTVEMFTAVDDQRSCHRLPALRGTRTARQHRHPLFTRNRDRRRRILAALQHDNTQRLDLVDRGIGRIASAAERVEQHLAADFPSEARFEARSGRIVKRHAFSRKDLVSNQARVCGHASMATNISVTIGDGK